MIRILMSNGQELDTNDGDLNFWMQRMSTTDVQLIKGKSTGTPVAINPKYIMAVIETNE